jgi:hypothetical protein
MARVGLLAYFELLFVLVLLGHRWTPPPLASLLDGAKGVPRLLSEFAAYGTGEIARFAPLGLLAALALQRRSHRPAAALLVAALACVLSLFLATVVRALEIGWHGPWPGPLDLMLPTAGCLLGTSLAMKWRRGGRALLTFVPKLALASLVLVAFGGALLAGLVLEAAPLSFDAVRTTSAEKRRLYYLLESKNPRRIPFGRTETLRLSERDIGLILAWGLSGLGAGEHKARAEVGTQQLTVLMSARARGGDRPRYMNLVAGGQITVEGGRLRLRARRLRLGRLEVPQGLLAVMSPVVSAVVSGDRRMRPLIASVHRLEMGAAGIDVTYGRVDLPPGLVNDVFRGEGSTDDVLPAVRAQVRSLLEAADHLPAGEARVGAAVDAAFALAGARSSPSTALLENKAALLALGILLGHWRVEPLVGPVVDQESWPEALHAFRDSTLRGRKDWTRHFFVSAALAVVATEGLSNEAGLFKEELDADKGGSGFSFADLLADRAGTAFALAATRDEKAARTMQERLAQGFRVDEFFPPAADLPEGLAETELQAGYGGVGGEGYGRLLAEIERRVATCAAYRESEQTP